MTRRNGPDASVVDHVGPENTPRLRLKPKAAMTGHVDGAWWPRSDDLAIELPDLLAVRLDGYRRQPASTLQVLGANGGERILLLVVPPHSEPDAAHEAMMTAAAPGNASTVDDLLAASAHVL